MNNSKGVYKRMWESQSVIDGDISDNFEPFFHNNISSSITSNSEIKNMAFSDFLLEAEAEIV
jgi:hypothetical protein